MRTKEQMMDLFQKKGKNDDFKRESICITEKIQ